LIASFAHHILRQGAVVFYFLQSALAAFQSLVVSQVNTPHSPLTDNPANAIATPQHFPGF
jgi:hypothetical protein